MKKNILEVKHLSKRFGDKEVHKDVTFHLKEGETLGLLGNSGTGKSVLLRSIIGLENIDGGEIIFKNDRIDQLSEEKLFKVRTMISYSFQYNALFDSDNVFENVAYPLFEHTKLTEEQIKKKVTEVLVEVNLSGSEEIMPSDLSGGMQKRAGLARTIVLDPDIILYDEPTAGLDPVNVENVCDLINKFKAKGMSSILCTHDIPAARKVCDRVIILDHGRVAFEGPVAELDNSDNPIVQKFLLNS